MNSITLRFTLGIALIGFTSFSVLADDIYHAQGEFSGEPTATSILLQTRLTAIPGPEVDAEGDIPGISGIVRFEYSLNKKFSNSELSKYFFADPSNDFIVRAEVHGLKPATTYYYRALIGPSRDQLSPGPTRSFKTLSPADGTDPVRFAMGSCQNYAFFMYGKNAKSSPAPEADRKLGYPTYAAMKAMNPDFFIGTGDIVYYDHPVETAAKTLPELRKKWHEQFRMPRLVEFFAQTPAYWLKDDHDYRFNDSDLGGDRAPDPKTGINMFREQMPILPMGDHESPTYRTHRVHQNLQLWFLEGRDYRSPNRMKDGPDKSIWGKEQRAWLERTLKQSDAKWKILISPTPMVGPDSKNKKDNHANLGGFRHEADSFFSWLNEKKIENVMVFCGDRHWQYHSIHPSGVEEFSCGAINDENAISGSYPGTPNSTDPEGKIKQPFHYKKPSGGFLFIEVDEDQLAIEFQNDEGERLYRVRK